MFSKVYIFGAPGSGVSTLGRALAQSMGYAFFDTDDYYWYTTDALPFRRKRNPQHRLRLLQADLDRAEHFVLAGALLGWGESLSDRFDVLLYRWLPPDIREARIREREIARYGGPERLQLGGDLYNVYTKFLEWARKYDEPSGNIRSREYEQTWLAGQKQPKLFLEKNCPTEQLLEIVEHFFQVNSAK